MTPEAYVKMAEQESSHWWYVGRRHIISQVIKSLKIPTNSEILEIGAGTGGNLSMLSKYGQVTALESNPEARVIAHERHPETNIQSGSLPHSLPIIKKKFDLICLFDVLEHISEDETALASLAPLLKPTGHIILTVPAYQWLFSNHDIYHHHFRRYNSRRLKITSQNAGLLIKHASYFNSLLFPAAAAARILEKFSKSSTPIGGEEPSHIINRILVTIFSCEAPLVASSGIPFGLSLLAILKPKNSPRKSL